MGLDDIFNHAQSAPEPEYVSPYAERGTDIKENFFKDVEDFTRGAGAIWSTANLRARESALEGFRSATKDPNVEAELISAGAAPLIRPSDAASIGRAAKGIGDYYKGEYFGAPANESTLPGYADRFARNLGQHFVKSPMNTVLDLGLVGPLVKGPSWLGKAALGTRVGSAVGSRVMGALPEAVQASNVVPQSLRQLTPAGQASLQAQGSVDLLSEAQNKYAQNIARDRRAMERATNDLSLEDRKLITPLHEGTDEALRAELQMSQRRIHGFEEEIAEAKQNLANFFRANGGVQRGVTQKAINAEKKHIANLEAIVKRQKAVITARAEALKQSEMQRDAFHVPIGEHQLRVVLPRYLAEHGGGITAEQALSDPEHVNAMRRMYGDLSRKGELPGYVPLIGKNAFGQTEKRAFTTVLGSGFKAGRSLRDYLEALGIKFGKGQLKSLADVPQEQRPGYLKKLQSAKIQVRQIMEREIRTVRSEMHEMDLGKAILERSYRARRFQATEELVRKLMQKAPKEGLSGWEQVDLQEEFATAFPDVTKEGGQVPQFAHGNFGDTTVTLPRQVAHLLRESIHGEAPPGLVDKWNNIYKMFLFTLDPSFGPRLFGQTAVIQGSMIKTPKDVVRMAVASLIAANPKATALLPDELLLSHGAHGGDIQLLEAGINFAKVKATKGQLDYVPHNWQRRTAAVYRLLQHEARAPLEFKPLIADAMNTDAALERLAKGVETPADVQNLQRFLKGYLGDYSTLARLKRRGFTHWFPLAPWVAHAWQLVKTLPVNNPYKTALTHVFGQMIVKEVDADEHGRVPIRDVHGALAYGPNGGIMYYQGPHMDLYESGMELLKDGMLAFDQLSGMVFSGNMEGIRKFHLPSAITPAVSVYNAVTQDNDPSTTLPWSVVNPNVVEVYIGGEKRYYNKRTGKIMETAGLSLPAAFLRTTFKKPLDAAQRAIASPYLPSPFTSPAQPNPRSKAGLPLKASRVESVLANIGQAANEKIPPASRIASKRQKLEQRRIQRQLNLRGEVLGSP